MKLELTVPEYPSHHPSDQTLFLPFSQEQYLQISLLMQHI